MTAKTPKPNAEATSETWADGPLFAPVNGAIAGWSAQNARAALASVEAIERGLKTWRHFFDVTAAAVRRQQDLALSMTRAQWSNVAAIAPEEDNANPPALFAPIYAAARAYEKVGEGVLQAQCNALEAMTHADHSEH